VARTGLAQARLAIQRLDAHAAHERGHVTPADVEALILEQPHELARPQEGVFQVQLIEPAHDGQVLRTDWLRLVVQRGARYPQQLALTCDRHVGPRIDQRLALGPGKRPSALDKKSRSMVSSPILACSSAMRSWESSAWR
jgi:hypothetical protein